MTKPLVFDYVIVGAGSAGCALAARLSASGEHSVLLLEAGGTRTTTSGFMCRLVSGKLLTNERYAWKFETEPQAELKGKRIYWPRGKVLGGSSSINGMAYVWGDPLAFDGWAQQGNAGWSFADVEPYFKRLENNSYTPNTRRGHEGPVRITDRKLRDRDALSDALHAVVYFGGYRGNRRLQRPALTKVRGISSRRPTRDFAAVPRSRICAVRAIGSTWASRRKRTRRR